MNLAQGGIPLLGMGTWGMGGKFERDPSNIDASIEALRYGMSIGINLIDVAELYGEGLTEEIVGEAIADTKREDVAVISKVWKTNLHYDDVLNAADGSLKRLKTDYIDLYLIHWPNEAIPIKETMEAMEYLLDQKKIRAIGLSNFSVPLMKEAERYLKNTAIAANQVEYNLGARAAEADIIPYCKENNIRVIAYRPFAKGTLIQNSSSVQNELTKKYNKTPNQIALNWLISQGITAIPKSSDHGHLKENAGALGWQLDTKDVELLRSAT
jgi:diketogulonate reductase-like aldo/keto reductase